jgi:Zn-dependent membrane protease YugP
MYKTDLRLSLENIHQTPIRSGLTGKEIAEKMLRDNGIYDVDVISVRGS